MADLEVEDHDLASVIASEIRQARSYDKTELAGKRARAIDYLRGVMNDTPARPNGSQQTDRTFSETVSWLLPGIVSVFAAANKFVQYSLVREGDSQWATDATDYTNHTFWEGGGYKVVYDATYNALTLGNGIVCSYWQPPRSETKWFKNKTEMEVAELIEEGWQPTGVAKPGKPTTDIDAMTGEEFEVQTISVKLMKEARAGKICDEALKPENLLLNSNAVEIDKARFVAYYHDDKTRSDLVEMAEDYGWDKAAISDLPSHNRTTEDEVGLARDNGNPIDTSAPLKSSDPIDLYECYIRADLDGDGIAEIVQAWYAGEGSGGTLLGHEEWEDDIPFTDVRCYPVPHRYDAESAYDRTSDIQQVKTVLKRGLLDNTYAVSLPMFEAEAGTIANPDILAAPRFGGTIWRTKGSTANAPIIRHEFPFVGDKILMSMQYMDEQASKRTGISRTTMALDPEALQNQTAEASRNFRDAGYSQVELIARNAAQYGGWSTVFKKRLTLAINHQEVAQIPDKKEESGFRTVYPQKWDPNMAVMVDVGLGTGSRDRDMSMMKVTLDTQVGMADRLAAAGLTSKALEFMPKIRKAAVEMTEASGVRNPDEYYPEVTDEEIEQFKMAAEEAKKQPPLEVQLKQMDVQAAAETEKLKAQGNAVKEKAQLEADLMSSDRDRQNELVLEDKRQVIEREKMQMDYQLEIMKLQQERELAVMQMSVTEVESEEGGGDKPGDKAKPKSRTRRKVVESMGPRQNEIVAGFGSLAQAVAQLSARMERMEQSNMAEVEIIRGPDGKATGARKRMAMN